MVLLFGVIHTILIFIEYYLYKKKLCVLFVTLPGDLILTFFVVENNVLKINDLYRYSLGQFMYQLNNNTLPSALNLIFIKNKTIHKYPTRQSDKFHLPLTRTLLAKSIFTYAGPKLCPQFKFF